MGDLTALQEKAAQLHALHGKTKSDAYREAGYSVENMLNESINQEASRLFALPHVSSRVEKLQALALERQMVTQDRIVAEYAKLAFLNIKDLYDENNKLKDIHSMDDNAAAAIAGIETEQLFEGFGEDREQIGFTKKVKLVDKKGALDSLAKYLSMFVERREYTGKDGKDLPPSIMIVADKLAIKEEVKSLNEEF